MSEEDVLKGMEFYKVSFPEFWAESVLEQNGFYKIVSQNVTEYVKAFHKGEEYLDENKMPEFWHDHCFSCWDRVYATKKGVYYCTTDYRMWICEKCFLEQKDKYGFVVIEN